MTPPLTVALTLTLLLGLGLELELAHRQLINTFTTREIDTNRMTSALISANGCSRRKLSAIMHLLIEKSGHKNRGKISFMFDLGMSELT